MFSTHQGRLPKELALSGITEIKDANRYLRERYLPTFNAEFMQPALEEGSAFVGYLGGDIDDVLCEHHQRVVGNDNCVSFEGLSADTRRPLSPALRQGPGQGARYPDRAVHIPRPAPIGSI